MEFSIKDRNTYIKIKMMMSAFPYQIREYVRKEVLGTCRRGKVIIVSIYNKSY
jgi:hypothetical protein